MDGQLTGIAGVLHVSPRMTIASGKVRLFSFGGRLETIETRRVSDPASLGDPYGVEIFAKEVKIGAWIS
ncbi:hypothetical protein AB4Y77_21285 [Paenarthrobacter sp. YAF11_1]|uniref:hypothetical protein n=1 Tax=Paenarthrobacter sp. YAF11_1 TaxID=3233074 RepID=UPI003F99AC20